MIISGGSSSSSSSNVGAICEHSQMIVLCCLTTTVGHCHSTKDSGCYNISSLASKFKAYCSSHRVQSPHLPSHWDVCIKPSQFSGGRGWQEETPPLLLLPSPSEIGEHNTYINALNVLTAFSPGMQEATMEGG